MQIIMTRIRTDSSKNGTVRLSDEFEPPASDAKISFIDISPAGHIDIWWVRQGRTPQ